MISNLLFCQKGYSALHFAAEKHWKSCMEVLSTSGANVDLQTKVWRVC